MLKYIRLGPGEPRHRPLLRRAPARRSRRRTGIRARSRADGGQPMIFDYETLKLIWWVLRRHHADRLRADRRLGPRHRHAARRCSASTDDERRVILNSIEPNWEGNQTWLIIARRRRCSPPGRSSTRRRFPACTSRCCSCCSRCSSGPVGFKYRSKVDDPRWRSALGLGLFIGGFVPALVFGVAFGNLLQGVPFHFDARPARVLHGHVLAAAQSVRAACRRAQPRDAGDARRLLPADCASDGVIRRAGRTGRAACRRSR